jgi:hypothetical protein
MSKILITGCGRSGTNYICNLLNKSNLELKHEKMGKDGIVSWILTYDKNPPWGPKFSDNKYKIILHQIRDPIKCIQSVFTFGERAWKYIDRCIPEISQEPEISIKAIKYWYYWNKKAEQLASYSYRIEDIDFEYSKICNFLNIKPNLEALKTVDRKTNTRKKEGPDISYNFIQKKCPELFEDILSLSKKYKYYSCKI